MAKSLVIVESPAKARTINQYLGKEFEVKASVGHIKDLPKKRGIDEKNGFLPEYVVIEGKEPVIKELRSAGKKAEHIYLAPDPDREGEAIAWHIASIFDADDQEKIKRITFNEITKKAVRSALDHAGGIDMNRVNAQQARRVLDRIVGYDVSSLLWNKVSFGLSAGRVQSVALRLLVEREREILAFVPEEYWLVTAELEHAQKRFHAKLSQIEGRKADLKNEDQVKAALAKQDGLFAVENVETKERRRRPVPPFITSTLQQAASTRLNFPVAQTMRTAQKLYEGVPLGRGGEIVGLITYMRTDSTRISGEALAQARDYIGSNFGGDYLPEKPNFYKSKKGAQDAHEAIRPTSVERTPEMMAKYLDARSLALYSLIWSRFVASQMMPAVYDATSVDLKNGACVYRASGSVLKFDGYLRAYTDVNGDDTENGEKVEGEETLPELKIGDRPKEIAVLPEQKFTQPPARFNEASLVKTLEALGIGRPSTYASIIKTVKARQYVTAEGRQLRPTDLGMAVTDLLIEGFPDVFNVNFTARMEEDLDKIEEGAMNWQETLAEFHTEFDRDLEKARTPQGMRSLKKGEPTEIACPKCGKPLLLKWSRNGQFLSCGDYPECKGRMNAERDEKGNLVPVRDKVLDEECPKCSGKLAVKRGRYGEFVACTNYPECDYIKKDEPKKTGVPCGREGCDGELLERKARGRVFYGCSNYPKCRFTVSKQPVSVECGECGSKLMIVRETKKDGKFFECPACKHKQNEDGSPREAKKTAPKKTTAKRTTKKSTKKSK